MSFKPQRRVLRLPLLGDSHVTVPFVDPRTEKELSRQVSLSCAKCQEPPVLPTVHPLSAQQTFTPVCSVLGSMQDASW